ncbi:hypothetical protein GGR56DRAFT_672225 [Xylariaceae sp. FL0804]|nr:hypothetical protein GGR56DRAFT_672225 [Xylariaceae sp. FL0804]
MASIQNSKTPNLDVQETPANTRGASDATSKKGKRTIAIAADVDPETVVWEWIRPGGAPPRGPHRLDERSGRVVARDPAGRDAVTGRDLLDDATSCLRCAARGFASCTLRYAGDAGATTTQTTATQCTRCRRAAAPCIWMLPPTVAVPFTGGPPWKDPNWVVGVAPGERRPDGPELEALLEDHFLGGGGGGGGGDLRHVGGGTFAPRDARGGGGGWALPSFKGITVRGRDDLPAAAASSSSSSEKEEEKLTGKPPPPGPLVGGWRAVLPTRDSLRARPAPPADKLAVFERWAARTAVERARDMNDREREDFDEVWASLGQWRLLARGYEPRLEHLCDQQDGESF